MNYYYLQRYQCLAFLIIILRNFCINSNQQDQTIALMTTPIKPTSNQDQGVGSVGAPSGPSSGGDQFALSKKTSVYQDEIKLRKAIGLYTTLANEESAASDEGQITGNFQESSSKRVKGNKLNATTAIGASNLRSFYLIERFVLQKLFKINHVLLRYQSVSVPCFHFILLLSFIQIFYNIFIGVEIQNEFSRTYFTEHALFNGISDANFNSTNSSSTGGSISQDANKQYATEMMSQKWQQGQNYTFTLNSYLQFSNFQMYIIMPEATQTQIDNEEGIQQDSPYNAGANFLILYSSISGIFVLFIIGLFALSGRTFEECKSEEISECKKFFVKLTSFIYCFFIHLLCIPLTVILLQGYRCEEKDFNGLPIGIQLCDSLEHKLLIVTSTLLLLLYLMFLFQANTLYTSNSFESETVPWGSFERRLGEIRIIIQLILAIGQTFDKQGDKHGYINIVCFVLQTIVAFKRVSGSIIINQSVFHATIIFESLQMWLFFTISIQKIGGFSLTIMSLAFIIVIGILFGISLAFCEMRKRKDILTLHCVNTIRQSQLQYMTYFLRLYELIESQKPQSLILMHGLVRNHFQQCQVTDCKCKRILERLDSLKKHQLMQKFCKQHTSQNNINYGDDDEEKYEMALHQIEIVDIHCSGTNSIGACPEITQTNDLPIGAYLSANALADKHSMAGFKHQRMNKRGGTCVYDEASATVTSTYPLNNNRQQSNGLDSSVVNWLQQKKRRQILDEKLNQLLEDQEDSKKVMKIWYKFMVILIHDSIEKYPKHCGLRFINAYIQKTKLNNEFKALFEMMNCELNNPIIYEKFEIFRMKIEIEQTLVKQQHKLALKIGMLDVNHVHKYEKLYQKYQLFEYLATNSALSFWRELQSKHIDASILQERGSEISKYYEIIQDAADHLKQIYPDEIKFLFRYGNFLLYIMQNEFDALEHYRFAQNAFMNKMGRKTSSAPDNEDSTFGSNSASGIIMISATSKRIGTIIHTNEEIEFVLGYKREELIGQNINKIMPRPIAKAHDRLIQRYFETAKPTVIEIKRQLFGATKEGYLREVELLVKVFPQINDKIVFVGFIKRHDRFDDMEHPKAELERFDKQYIITDTQGNITNVTEGLNVELGLNAKFFHYTDSIFQTMLNLEKICPALVDPDNQDALEIEGLTVSFDTKVILRIVDLEGLTAEEVIDARRQLGQYQAYVQLKRLVIHPQFCTINIYRVILLGRQNDTYSQQPQLVSGCGTLINNECAVQDPQFPDQDKTHTQQSLGSAALMSSFNPMSASSMSSATSNSVAFNRVIKDFKKALGERRTPKGLIFLNRMIGLILIISLILSSVDFSLLKTDINSLNDQGSLSINSEIRTLKIVLLASNVRSLINIANDFEFDSYDELSVSFTDRHQYLSQLIQNQTQDLQLVHQAITQQRKSKNGNIQSLQSGFEYQNIDLYRIDEYSKVSTFQIPFRVAFQQYLNTILSLNQTTPDAIVLPRTLLVLTPQQTAANNQVGQTTFIQKSVYFLITNGYRQIQTMSHKATDFLSKILQEGHQFYAGSSFLGILIAGTVLSIISLFIVLQSIWTIEKNKAQILSLYALLEMKEIEGVFKSCEKYISILNEGSLSSQILNDSKRSNSKNLSSTMDRSSAILLNSIGQADTSEIVLQQAQTPRYYQSSEDDDEMAQCGDSGNMNPDKKRYNKLPVRLQRSGGQYPLANIDIYHEIIKRIFQKIKQVQQKDQNLEDNMFNRQLQEKHRQREMGESTKNIEDPQTAKADKKQSKYKGKPSKLTFGGVIRKKRHHQGSRDKVHENKHSTQRNNASSDNFIEYEHSGEKQRMENIWKRRSRAQKSSNPDIDVVIEESSDDDDEQEEVNEGHIFEGNNEDIEKMQRKEERRRRREERAKQKKDNEELSLECEERKKYFFKTIKTKNWGLIFSNIIIGLLIAAYFIQVFFYHNEFKESLTLYHGAVPLFLNRFRYQMLGWAFMRERIIFNNSLDSFESENTDYRHNNDAFYMEMSMQNEAKLNSFKQQYSDIESSLVQFIQDIDSMQFCQKISSADIQSCKNFTNGLLGKGFQQALGNFNKRFADLQIRVNSKISYEQLLAYLSKNASSVETATQTIKIYFSTQELYMHKIVDQLVLLIKDTFVNYVQQYQQISQIIFLIFIVFQAIILLILRVRLINMMREDIFQSRGILNLIPDNFFEQNRQKVEKLIQSLKD